MDADTIVNGAYHSSVLSALVITNSMIAKQLFKTKPVELKLSMRDGAMLTANIYIAMMTKKALIKQGILPPNINLPPTS